MENNDVDIVLTTRELARVIKRAGINWKALPNEEFDDDLIGDYSGACVIFGVTGGKGCGIYYYGFQTLKFKKKGCFRALLFFAYKYK